MLHRVNLGRAPYLARKLHDVVVVVRGKDAPEEGDGDHGPVFSHAVPKVAHEGGRWG